MTRENFLFGIIGVLLGFIFGFMLHGVMSQRDAERASASTEQRQQLPADHPPVDNAGSGNPQQTMEQVQQTIAQARAIIRKISTRRLWRRDSNTRFSSTTKRSSFC